MPILNQIFYNQNTLKVAQDLLGCFLVRKKGRKIIKAIITETEAYCGFDDLASHASKGKTKRNELMFGEAGHTYIYLVYGMHWMLNIITEKKDFPAAVLIRGADLLDEKGEIVKKLDGPAKITKFFGITGKLNGIDITQKEIIWVERGNLKKRKIQKSKRVGVDYAKHSKEWEWNFKLI
ncbi:MAG: DNA-3-methyladenine glycosylase [Candidatus Moraniibacteriota bacterium]